MQADVENGGRDKNAYLLVPGRNEIVGRKAVQDYREQVRPFKQRQERFQARVALSGTPNALYVPTPAAIANIEFLKAFTNSAEHWKKAPESVKIAPGTRISQTSEDTRADMGDNIAEGVEWRCWCGLLEGVR